MKRFIAILLLFTTPFIQSCGLQGTPKTKGAKARYIERYGNYKVEMEKLNAERERTGFEPKKMMEFEEWLDIQPVSPEEMKSLEANEAKTAK